MIRAFFIIIESLIVNVLAKYVVCHCLGIDKSSTNVVNSELMILTRHLCIISYYPFCIMDSNKI